MAMKIASCLSIVLVLVAGTAEARVAPEPAFDGGETVAMGGLAIVKGTTTNLGFVNLSPAENRCTLALTDAGGAALAPPISLTLRPLEERPFLDVFAGREPKAGSAAAQAAISCQGSFSAFAMLSETATGHTELVAAEKVAASPALVPFKSAETPPCPEKADCFDALGVVHVPNSETPVGRVSFPAPAGAAKRFRVSLDVTVGPWYEQETNGKHLIYWFVVDRNFDMPGLLYFRGPNTYEAFARHGVRLTHPQKIKVRKKWKAEVGHTYHVDNDYDIAGKRFTVTITDVTDPAVPVPGVVLKSRPNVTAFNVKAGVSFLVDMGFPPDVVPTEVPSYDWTYSNVHVEAYVQK